MSLIFHKCIVLSSILISTLLAGISPWFMLRSFRGANFNISRRKRTKFIFSCMNMFSGGVFLGVCFMHLLPEVKERMDIFMSTLSRWKNFPATEFIVVIGFFLVLITEILVSKYLSKKHSAEKQSSEKLETNGLHNSPSSTEASKKIPEDTTQYGAIANSFVEDEQVERNCTESIQANRSTYFDGTEDYRDSDSDHCHQTFINSNGEDIAVRSVLLFLALSLHTIFDGLTLGLQEDVTKLYSLFTAVIIHKILVGFTLGLQIFEYTIWTIRRSFLLMFVFACISPIGMTIGIMVGRINGHEISRALCSAILNSLATGTFLYVTFIEIIGREFAKKISVLQILCAITGFGLMTGLVFFEWRSLFNGLLIMWIYSYLSIMWIYCYILI